MNFLADSPEGAAASMAQAREQGQGSTHEAPRSLGMLNVGL